MCSDILGSYAQETDRLLASIRHQPVGSVFCVEPWNVPFHQLARVAGPQQMVGNTVVMKPAQSGCGRELSANEYARAVLGRTGRSFDNPSDWESRTWQHHCGSASSV